MKKQETGFLFFMVGGPDFMELFKVVTIDEARKLIGDQAKIDCRSETVPLTGALNRRLAEAIVSPVDIPGFSRSIVDGFAVIARDTFGATEGLPAYLNLLGEVLMGAEAGIKLSPGGAVKIATGGMLPPQADAVVMVEHTEEVDADTIAVVRPVAPGENVIRKGEDVAFGEMILPAGQILRPQDLGLLAGAGVTSVPVAVPLRVGIVSTGDEVVPPETEPGPGQIRDTNSYILHGLVTAAGGQAVIYGLVPDRFAELQAALAKALAENDIVLVSGGSSVGTRDMTAQVLETLGRPGVLFHGLSLRPGKPTIGAVIEGKPVFGLPGHPVSAMLACRMLVTPLVKHGRYLPEGEPEGYPLSARLGRSLASGSGRDDYVRVRLEWENGELIAHPILGKSGLLSTMVKAQGLVRIPLDREGIQAGEIVPVYLFGN